MDFHSANADTVEPRMGEYGTTAGFQVQTVATRRYERMAGRAYLPGQHGADRMAEWDDVL